MTAIDDVLGQPREKWEYHAAYIEGNQEARNKMLNELGQQGWELVSVDFAYAYFKRLIRS